jgi:hypothetical protein
MHKYRKNGERRKPPSFFCNFILDTVTYSWRHMQERDHGTRHFFCESGLTGLANPRENVLEREFIFRHIVLIQFSPVVPFLFHI